MTAPLVIRVKDRDNVAIAVHDLETGVEVMPGVVTRDPIPQAHKVALVDIPKGVKLSATGLSSVMPRMTLPAAAGSMNIC